MRQLVSVVSDEHVLYFVHDGNDVEQVAQIKNPGSIDVHDVIGFGVSLAALYEPPAPLPPVRAVALPAAAKPKPLPQRKPYERTPRPYFDNANLIAIVRGHPKSTARQITRMACPPDVDHEGLGLIEHVQTKLSPLVKRGLLVSERLMITTISGSRANVLHYSVPPT